MMDSLSPNQKLAKVSHQILNVAVSVRVEYLSQVDHEGLANRISDYRNSYAAGTNEDGNETTDGWLAIASRTRVFFPGRNLVRPRIDFGSSSRAENLMPCRKNYRKSDSPPPGIFTVQCCCRFPKLIGLSVMSECERISTALYALLSRSKLLPRVTCYDNSCIMAKSIAVRARWVKKSNLVLCDRFHYKPHSCNSVCDPDIHQSCSAHYTSGAKSIKQQCNF